MFFSNIKCFPCTLNQSREYCQSCDEHCLDVTKDVSGFSNNHAINLCIDLYETLTSNCSTFNATKCSCFTDQICANNDPARLYISTSGTCVSNCLINLDNERNNASNSVNTDVLNAQSTLVCPTKN